MRIDQFLSQALTISRSDAKKHIRASQVRINGDVCKNASTQLSEKCNVTFNDSTVFLEAPCYYALHKPAGYVCSHHDDGHLSALRLLPRNQQKLHFAGRLDADTTGLVLISSEGAWIHQVSSPQQQKEKHYLVDLAQPLSEEALNTLSQGIVLRGETKPTLPCTIERTDIKQCIIILQEGRYHQVKRMFAAIGNHVQALHRSQIGSIKLNSPPLAEGHYRPLSLDEYMSFYD